MFSHLKPFHISSLLKNMYHSLSPTTLTSQHMSLSHLLEKCSTIKQLNQIHAQIIIHGLTKQTLALGKLISLYAMADLGYAHTVFDKMPEQNRFMYNSLIRAYTNRNDPSKALFLYTQMNKFNISPNEFTIPFVLKAYACELNFLIGVTVHGQLVKLGIGSVVCVQNALVNFYVLGGSIYDARKVFDEIIEKTLVSWNIMIGSYSKIGYCEEATLIFRKMRQAGVEPDKFTFMSLFSISSQIRDIDLGMCLHCCIVITGENNDLYVHNAIVDMYAKCGDLHTAQAFFDRMPNKNVVSWTSLFNAYARNGIIERAREIFKQMPAKNVVSWNSMISCYVQENLFREALHLFREMRRSEIVPDEITLIITLNACSQLGDLIMGIKIHDYICNNCINFGLPLSNALVDMYAKCGSLQLALQNFVKILDKNVVSYNVIIGAFALHGYGIKAIEAFEKMQAEAIRPDNITFTGLLSACTHSGFIEIGRYYFNRMFNFYWVPYEIEHYACMIDLLGRGGRLGEAIEIMREMKMKPDVVIWGALLGACKSSGNFKIAKIILKQLLELESFDGGIYVLLSSIYSEAGRWDDVEKLRKMMKDHGIEKCDAISSIEIDGIVCEFMVDDKKNDISVDIYAVLDHLMDNLRSVGYLHRFFEY